jgi:hypothetical protein
MHRPSYDLAATPVGSLFDTAAMTGRQGHRHRRAPDEARISTGPAIEHMFVSIKGSSSRWFRVASRRHDLLGAEAAPE